VWRRDEGGEDGQDGKVMEAGTTLRSTAKFEEGGEIDGEQAAKYDLDLGFRQGWCSGGFGCL
jgi:hypothetical protein